jgi:hypothetical protein
LSCWVFNFLVVEKSIFTQRRKVKTEDAKNA